jgi:hypothetical protein
VHSNLKKISIILELKTTATTTTTTTSYFNLTVYNSVHSVNNTEGFPAVIHARHKYTAMPSYSLLVWYSLKMDR